jgi:hypothetical protein
MNELTTPPETAAASPVDPMTSLIERIAFTPDLPMERLTAIMDMQERQMNKQAEQDFNRAFAAAMAEMPAARKSGKNKHNGNRYSTLSDLVEAARPALSAHGLALNWTTKSDGKTLTVTAIVRHECGWREETSMSAPVDAGKGVGAAMNVIQSHGSTETYLKRYTGFAILGLASDDFDDDGQASSAPQSVSADQFIQLRNALEESGMEPRSFHLAFGHRDPDNAQLEQFPASKFKEAMSRLEKYVAAKEAAA